MPSFSFFSTQTTIINDILIKSEKEKEKQMKKAQVFCRFPKQENSEGIDFYLQFDGETYFLFNQRYRSNIPMFFEFGMPLEMALKMPKKHAPVVIKNICEKLPSYIRYIEREYEITVFNKTMRKGKAYC